MYDAKVVIHNGVCTPCGAIFVSLPRLQHGTTKNSILIFSGFWLPETYTATRQIYNKNQARKER